MTIRAERLAKYLESVGWNMDVQKMSCPNLHYVPEGANFCPECGTKAERLEGSSALQELEDGIAYALGEVKRLKGASNGN